MLTQQKKSKTNSLKGLRVLVCGLFAFLLTAFNTINAQTVTIEKAMASGCYYYSGASKTTISVQVGWTGASSADLITVTLDGSSTRTIKPQSYYDPGSGSAVAGPIVTPQVIAFEINADGANHNLVAVMSGAHSATSTMVGVAAPSSCSPTACSGTDLGGMVFYDNDADGVHDAGEIKGIANVTVTAWDKNGNSYTATSDLDGKYAFSSANGNSIAAINFPVRVEFTNFPANTQGYSGPSVNGNKSSVRFVSVPACGVDCGGVNPSSYSQSNPVVFSSIYTNGNPLGGGSAGANKAIIAHNYNNMTDLSVTTIATAEQVGSVWAHAWNKYHNKLFSAAFLKRHVGLGPLGLGGIYAVDYSVPASPVVTSFLDVSTIGINVGSVGSNTARGLNATKTTPSADPTTFDLVGKVGIGGMDLSEDGNTIYLMNLYDKKVYAIDITAYLTSGTLPTAADVTSYQVPDPGCVGGEYHPFALKVYDGKLYAGMVCDASTGTKSNLVGFIKAMDLTTNTWGDVFDFPLTYPKGYPSASKPQVTGWNPWTSSISTMWNGSGVIVYPTPMLSDIEFDLDGAMVIALIDRAGHQMGNVNYDNAAYNSGEQMDAGGDLLRAFYSNGTYVLENNAKAGPVTGYAPNNNQGPGFGEFYHDDFSVTGGYHTEMATGGLLIVPGSGEVLAGMVDPSVFSGGNIWANGVRKNSNSTGQPIAGKAYYTESGISLFGKANGMGDVEAATEELTFLEIGNYVWYDANGNGVQDPTESGIQGVKMSLYNSTTGALVKTTTTDANGYYYFSTVNGDNIQTNTSYCVLAGDASQFNSGSGLFTIGSNTYQVSPSFNGQGANALLNDNNFSASILSTALAAMPAGLPKYCVTTGGSGFVDHSIDLGLACIKPNAGIDGTICGGSCMNLTGANPTSGTWTAQAGNPSGATLGSTVAGVANVCFTVTASGNFNFIYTSPLGCSDTMTVVATPRGSIGNYVWLDANNNGLQDEPTSAGINGVTVELWNATTNTLVASTTTANNGGNPGYYNFNICASGDYKVKFPTTNPSTATGLTVQTTTAGTDGNSDGNPADGFSPVFTMALTGTGVQVNNSTIDAGYLVCTKPNAGSDATMCGGQCMNITGASTTPGLPSTQGIWTALGTNPIGATLSSTTLGVASVCFTTSANGVYKFIYTVSGGCSDTMSINTNPKPNAGTDQTIICSGTTSTINLSASITGGAWTAQAGNPAGATLSSTVNAQAQVSIAVQTSGVYHFIYTVNGCSDTMKVTVTPTPTPTIGLTGPSAFCEGTNTTQICPTVWGYSNYQWYNNGVAVAPYQGVASCINPTTSGSYTLAATNGAGCWSNQSSNINITVYANPAPTISGSPLTVCAPATVTLTSTAAANYQWYKDGNIIAGATNQTYVATTNGNYTVKTNNGNGCIATSNSLYVNIMNAPSLQPIAGPTQVCVGNMIVLTEASGGGNWSSCNPSVATILSGGNVTGVSAGTSIISYLATNMCGSDTETYTITVKPYNASIGNYVWADTNRNGLQDEDASLGLNDVYVELYKQDIYGGYVVVATTRTANDGSGNPGYYNFPLCEDGNYKVKFPVYHNGMHVTTQDGTSCTDGNSDADEVTGYSPTIVINTSGVGCAKNNVTIDAGYIPASVTTGGGGGVESKTLGDVIATRLYGNAVNSVAAVNGYNNSVKFNNSGAIVNGVNDLSLNVLVPSTVTNTNAAYVTTPTDLVNFTNAVEVLAVDYTNNNITKAVAFGTKTLGDVYSHTKPICDRLKGAELQEVKNITVNGFNLMAYKVKQRTGEIEYAMNLSAGTATNRNSISLQSNWFTDSYQQDQKLYNFQLWAVSYDMVTAMATDIITKLQANGTVNTVTNADLPKAYISKGSRKGTDLTVTVNNNTTATTGYFELQEKANENSQVITRQIPFTVNANGTSNITIPVKDNYEGNIYVYLNNKLTDLVYLADGTWNLDYNKLTTSISKFDVTNESNPTTNVNEHRLFRNVVVTGTSKDYITVYKTMMGGGIEQNVSAFKSILFNANATGAGKIQVTLVKKSITNWNDQYTYTVDLDGDKEYGINFNQFKSAKYSNAINATDIVAVNFSFINSRGTTTTMNINLSKARFTNAAIATDVTAQAINVYPNPTTGKFNVSFTSDVAQALVLKVIETATGKTVKTQFVNASKGSNQTGVVLDNITSTNGLYIVTLEGDNTKYNPSKLMVNKK